MHEDPIVKRINSLWYKKGLVEKLKIPGSFPKIENPLKWALDMARNDPKLVSTAMRSAFKGAPEDNSMIYASRGEASEKVKKALIAGVEASAPVQLQVNGLDRKDPSIGEFLKKSFIPSLKEIHPFGFDTGMSLWITGPGHTYNVHCDLGDHCLLQLHGKKHIKLYGPGVGFDPDPIFNFDFRNNPERFNGPVIEVEINAGEMVFFAKGVMHEISIPDGYESVSASISANYLYPVINVISDINEVLGEQVYRIKDAFAAWDKFRAYLFDPTRYKDQLKAQSNTMPRDLKLALVSIVEPSSMLSKLDEYLDAWWSNFCKNPRYSSTGILPKPPENKIDILKQWEAEKLNS